MLRLQDCPLDFHDEVGSTGAGDDAGSVYHHLLDFPKETKILTTKLDQNCV
jgi:hypothetical protein